MAVEIISYTKTKVLSFEDQLFLSELKNKSLTPSLPCFLCNSVCVRAEMNVRLFALCFCVCLSLAINFIAFVKVLWLKLKMVSQN